MRRMSFLLEAKSRNNSLGSLPVSCRKYGTFDLIRTEAFLMRKHSSDHHRMGNARNIVLAVVLCATAVYAQSPHGKDFKMDCSYCHMPTTWKVLPKHMEFSHDAMTNFRLVGQHSELSCISCHKDLVFTNAKSTCISCHEDVHKGSLGINCQSCHTPHNWLVADIQQLHQRSRFPLVGAHQNVDCASCHTQYSQLYFPPINTECITCHSQQYYSTTTPNHVQAGFSNQCQGCHSIAEVSWGVTGFNHSFFPLTGEHKIANCFACHKPGTSGNFVGLSTSCYSCHSTDYINATTPVNHVAAGLPQNCQTCHTTTAPFTAATFTHPSTPFALTGAHTSVACQSCHKGSVTNTPSSCYSCHNSDFAATTNPNHVSAGFPQNCGQCHSTTNWTNATFDHNSTGFPLTGAHANVQCAQCHTNGYTTAPSTQCISCHQTDYNNTSNPPHASAGYPTSCSQCHTTAGWTPSTFNHTYFPIASGKHASPPLLCSQCHTDISNFAIFSCTTSGCHTQSETDTHHSGVQGYVYSSTSCYSCHANGGGD